MIKKKTPEGQIKSAVIQYLQFTGFYVVNMWQGQFSFKGIADIYALKNGRSIWLEIKTTKNKQSPDQIDFERNIKLHGSEYYVVRSVDDIISITGNRSLFTTGG